MKDTIYYDGACPMCRAEMAKLAECADQELELVDIHSLKDDEALPDKSALLERLHLKTADGSWLLGVEANVQAWQHTPHAKVWRILVWPIFKPFSKLAYEVWLRWRKLVNRRRC